MWIPEGYAQVNLKWGGSGLPNGAETTFGVSFLTAMGPDEVADIVEAAIQSSNFADGLSNQVTIRSIYVKTGPNDEGLFFEKAVTHPGTDGGQPVPPNTGILVKKVTSKGGRANQGRWFIPGCPEGSSPGTGELTPAAVTGFGVQWNKFRTDMAEDDLLMVLLHSEDRPGQTPLGITQLSVQGRLATQRRRMR